jgi:hypothetical protein
MANEMANQTRGHDDPTMRRLQQALADEEPTAELSEVLRRAASYLAAGPQAADEQSARGPALARARSAAVPGGQQAGQTWSAASSVPAPG